MTDHRVTDLSYGHLGEPSYDVDEHSWCFSRGISIKYCIQCLQPLSECIPPSLRTTPGWSKTNPNLRSPQRWLQKNYPEFGPAKAAITSMKRLENTVAVVQRPSTLFSMGKASDLDQTTGTKSTQIMAMVHGEAGNLLRLVRPRVEALKWDRQHDTKLRMINLDLAEDCYWLGDGGAIQQVTFGADGDGFTSWLAVLKPESVTILRPIYRRDPTASTTSLHTDRRYPPSRLSPNQILRLGNDRTGSSPNADVAFNPWYIRQFATVNQKGYWAVWDIEGQKQKRTTFRLRLGISGYIQDDPLPSQTLNGYVNDDGWGRVLWAGSFKTLLLCNRRNFTVFDLKTTPKRLYSPDLVRTKSSDWILDMKRSPVNLNHVFVLTTRRIFWLQIIEAGEKTEQLDKAGAKVLLSYQHFRNLTDRSAKIALLGEYEACTALLYMPRSSLVSTYRFTAEMGDSSIPICSQGSFVVKLDAEHKIDRSFDMFQTLCLISTDFIPPHHKPVSGPAKDYMDHNVRFYQLFGFSETLGLYHTLCATNWIIPGTLNTEPIRYQAILPPTIKDRRVGQVKTSYRYLEDNFIIPDGLDVEEEDATPKSSSDMVHTRTKSSTFNYRLERVMDNLYLSIDARLLFRASFLGRESKQPEPSVLVGKTQNLASYTEMIKSCVEQRKEHGLPGLMTFLDMVGNISFSEDIDEAALTLMKLLDVLRSDNETAGSMVATPFVTKPSILLHLEPATESKTATPNLSDVYDKLVSMWVSCLPRRTPGPARLAKEKLVRTVAIELYLSTVGVIIRNKSVSQAKAADVQADAEFVLPVRIKLDSSEIVDQDSSPNPSALPVPSLPSPGVTSSMPSINNVSPFQELSEDSAISRLRCYAPSIKTQPPLGPSRSAVLGHWPATPGANPSKYSWEASRKAIAEDQVSGVDTEEAIVRRREEARRRRRTEKFLKRQRVNTIDTTSQPLPALNFGSQPNPAEHPASSQRNDLAMSQPDRGIFGSRRGPKAFKKRRTMGF